MLRRRAAATNGTCMDGTCMDGQAGVRASLRPWIGRCAVVLLFMLHRPGVVGGQELVMDIEVKAAFLRNFAHYVTWPASAFAGEGSPWNVCILGNDPFGEVLERTLTHRTEQGRGFLIFRADTLDGFPSCHIIFVAFKDAAKRHAALARLKDRPVLTVGDAPEFLQEGGIIRFRVRDRVEMGINLDQARAVSLRIQAQMLEVAREVMVDGTVSTLR